MSQYKFACPHCGQKLVGDAALRGASVECPTCKQTFLAGGALRLTGVESPGEGAPPVLEGEQRVNFGRYSINDFLAETEQKERGQGVFELESERLLEVNLMGRIWLKLGSMVAYRGDIRFTRAGLLEHGVGRLLKRGLTREGTRLAKAEGGGTLYLADAGKKITILDLQGQSIFVNGNDLLALEDGIVWDVKMLKRISSMLAGGLFNVQLTGNGLIAITTHYEPLTLRVSPEDPVMTDPSATVAWSANLAPELKTDITFKTLLGRGSGESIQMCFRGDGFVVVQPYEEIRRNPSAQG